jgi:hypothetical protein
MSIPLDLFCTLIEVPSIHPATWLVLRYLNDANYFGGFEQEDLNQLFLAMQSNFKAWVSGFAPLVVGADIQSPAVQEFGQTLFNIRPDIAFSVTNTIFQSDLRRTLARVICSHILHYTIVR